MDKIELNLYFQEKLLMFLFVQTIINPPDNWEVLNERFSKFLTEFLEQDNQISDLDRSQIQKQADSFLIQSESYLKRYLEGV